MLGEPALGLDRGLAAHAGRGDRLAVDVVGAVAGDIDPGTFVFTWEPAAGSK